MYSVYMQIDTKEDLDMANLPWIYYHRPWEQNSCLHKQTWNQTLKRISDKYWKTPTPSPHTTTPDQN